MILSLDDWKAKNNKRSIEVKEINFLLNFIFIFNVKNYTIIYIYCQKFDLKRSYILKVTLFELFLLLENFRNLLRSRIEMVYMCVRWCDVLTW